MASGQALFLAISGGITAALFAELATRFPHEPASRAACSGIASGMLLVAFGFLLFAQGDRAPIAVTAAARPIIQAVSWDAP